MKKAGLALSLAVVAIAVWLVWTLREDSTVAPSIERASAATPAASARGEHTVAEPAVDSALRSEVALGSATATPADPVTAPADDAPTLVTGRVLDTAGAPLAGIRLALREHSSDVAVSGVGGRFEFPLPKLPLPELLTHRFELELAPGQRWISALTTPLSRGSCTDLLLVAAPAIELGGVVEDEQGAPVEGARVSVHVSSQELRDFPMKLDRSSPLSVTATSGSAGEFHITSAPAVAACKLRAKALDSMRGEVDLPMSTTLDLRIVLHADKSATMQALTGIVLGADGRPVEGASVMLGSSSTKSAADGHFELVLDAWTSTDLPLYAVATGFQPAIENDIADRLARKDASSIVLRLGPPTLEISGRVLLSDGSPARRWTVVLGDPTEITRSSVPAVTTEALADGSKKKRDSQSTGSEGEFTLRGLSARNYTVRAWNDESLLALRAERVAAGTKDLVLRVPADATWPQVRGVVVDSRGAPVAKVHVDVELVTLQSGGAQSWESSEGTSTKADGGFVLEDVPRREVRLSLSGEDVMERHFEVSELQMESELRLVVYMRCHFRLMCERKENAPQWANVLDADGRRLAVFTFQSGGWSSSTEITVNAGGATHAMAVSEQARTLVLFRDDKEMARVPINLLPGQVTDVLL